MRPNSSANRVLDRKERQVAYRAVEANFMREASILWAGGLFLAAAACAGGRGRGGSLFTAVLVGGSICLGGFVVIGVRAFRVHLPRQREVDVGKSCGHCGHPLAPVSHATPCPECGYCRFSRSFLNGASS